MENSFTLGPQSFTSLKADLHQDIHLHLAGSLMEHFIEGIAPLGRWQVNSERNICIYYSSHLG